MTVDTYDMKLSGRTLWSVDELQYQITDWHGYGDKFHHFQEAVEEAARRICRSDRQNRTSDRLLPLHETVDVRVKNGAGEHLAKRFILELREIPLR